MGEPLTEPGTDGAALAWHHCGRCGALYRAPKGKGAAAPCPECKYNPAPDYDSWKRKQQMLAAQANPKKPEERREPARKKTRKTGGNFVAKLVAGWVACLLLIVWLLKYRWDDDIMPDLHTHADEFKQAGEDADTALMQQAYPLCTTAINGFFSAAAPETRAQFVIDPFDALKSLANFDSFSPLTTTDGMAKNLLADVIHTPRGPTIEAIWETKQGEKIDAIFFQDKDTWKIDWRELLRYSEQPWGLFLSQAGEAEAEFRLLARERLGGERALHSRMSIVFYPPRFGHMRETSSPSPEFFVDSSSADGRLLATAFDAKKSDRGPFGSHLLPSDPDDTIRVRVRVRRNPEEKHNKFVLVKVLACHWFSLDEPGYEVPPAAPDHPST